MLPEATPVAHGEIAGVDHVVVKTQSAEAAKTFYGEQLGIRLALGKMFPSGAARSSSFVRAR